MNRSYAQKFLHYCSSSVLGTVGVSCYILADTFFVAQALGTNGLAALNLAIPVYNLIHGTGLWFGMGGATKFAIRKTSNDPRESGRIFTNTLYLVLAASMLFMLVGLCFPTPLAKMLGASGETLEMTVTYLRWLLLFAPAFLLNDLLLCFVRNDGAPSLSAAAMLGSSFSNIVLDYIFMFPLKLGIFGAVFATGLSALIGVLMMTPHLLRGKSNFRWIRTRLSRDIIRDDLRLGFPSLIGQLAAGITMVLFNWLILRLEGTTGVAAYGVVANLSLVITAIYTGLSQGVQPLLSSAYGKRRWTDVTIYYRYAIVTVVILSAALYLLLFWFADPIAAVFNREQQDTLQQIAIDGIRLYFLSNLFVGYNTVLSVYFPSVEHPFPAQLLSLLRGFLLLIPVAIVCSFLFGMTGIWLAYPLTEGVTAIAGFFWHRAYAAKQS